MRGAGRTVRPFRVPMASHVADTTLADAGAARIAWADGQSISAETIRLGKPPQ